ncbi:MAG: glycosyltransferase [Mycobacterium sp.]|nr:glycosyltransferase [Mycobacterium sp.]
MLPVMTALFAGAYYLLVTIDRNWLLLQGLRRPSLIRVSDAEALAIPDDDLPVYTVLLPVYNEPTIVKNLINGVGRLQYPLDKLEILLLIEEDDAATGLALSNLELQAIQVVVVPHGLPKTKPKACNYGMRLPGVRGQMMTIYDAEDIPDPLQLRRAVAAFALAGDDVSNDQNLWMTPGLGGVKVGAPSRG